MKFINKLFFSILLIVLTYPVAKAQLLSDTSKYDEEFLIQFSGVLLTADSLKAVPYVSVRVKNTNKGTVSNEKGIFSIIAKKRDTILFSSIGYKTETYIVPENLNGQFYSMIKVMSTDTLTFDPVIVRPFVSKELFQHYLVNADLPNDAPVLDESLSPEALREMAFSLPMDGSESQRYQLNNQIKSYYYSGQTVPINILNPFAWAEFVKAWKRGDFKSKKDKKLP